MKADFVLYGILNVTPDSFSDGGKFAEPAAALQHALMLVDQGASVIDIGAESTRPGASTVGIQEEWQRLEAVIKLLRKHLSVKLSLDTRKAVIAKLGITEGIDIINDVSGGRFDPHMFDVVARSGADYILMHSRGEPANMQQCAHYQDLIRDIATELDTQYQIAKQSGVKHILLDPGFGFAKSVEQNDYLLEHLSDLSTHLAAPILVGVSRKRFLREKAGADAKKLLELSVKSCVKAYQQGVRHFRVHDVAATKQALLALST